MAILLPLKYGKETQKHLSSSLLQFAANKQTKATGREPFVPIKLSDSVHLLNEWRNAALILNEALQQSKTDELLSDITKNIQFNTMIKQTIRAGNVFLIAKNQNPFSGTSSVQWERTNQIQGSTPAFNSLPSGKHILGSCTKVSGELPPHTPLQRSFRHRTRAGSCLLLYALFGNTQTAYIQGKRTQGFPYQSIWRIVESFQLRHKSKGAPLALHWKQGRDK